MSIVYIGGFYFGLLQRDKKKLVNNEIYKRVKDYSKNKNDLSTYYNVGKLLVKAQGGEKRAKYGDSLIKLKSILRG